MDHINYEIEHKLERKHWWFTVRRKLFSSILSDYKISKSAKILDIGTSTGTNLRMLRDDGYTNYIGMDIAQESKEFCAAKGLGNVLIHDVSKPFPESSFDVIIATDIIEHIDDDKKALNNIFNATKPGGFVLITVPCFMFLWGPQDDLSHHKRRYIKKELVQLIKEQGFRVLKSFYFNFLLLAPIFMMRKLLKMLGKKQNENEINSSLINKIFQAIFTLDVKLAKVLPIPFGVSCCVIVQKPLDSA